MRSRLALTVVAFVGYGIIDAAPANAEDKYYYNAGSGGDWSASANWHLDCSLADGNQGEPSATESARICSNEIVAVTNNAEVAEFVYVEGGARIDLTPSPSNPAKLTLGDGAADQTSTLIGNIKLLVGSIPDIATLDFHADKNHTFTRSCCATGDIVGVDDDAVINVPMSRTVTIDDAGAGGSVRVRGHLKISGPGSFHNDGRVLADTTNGVLDILISGTLDDTSRSGEVSANYRWGVIKSTATLQFNQDVNCNDTSTQLLGSFYVADGTLRIGQDNPTDDLDVETRGDLLHTGGKIVVGTSDSIAFNVAVCP